MLKNSFKIVNKFLFYVEVQRWRFKNQFLIARFQKVGNCLPKNSEKMFSCHFRSVLYARSNCKSLSRRLYSFKFFLKWNRYKETHCTHTRFYQGWHDSTVRSKVMDTYFQFQSLWIVAAHTSRPGGSFCLGYQFLILKHSSSAILTW